MSTHIILLLLLLIGLASTAPLDAAPGPPIAPHAHMLLHALIPAHNEVRDLTCLECRTAAGLLEGLMAQGVTVDQIEEVVIFECQELNLFPPDVCRGMVLLSGAEVLHVLNTTHYNHETVCGFLLGGSHCASNQLESWVVDIPAAKPAVVHPEPEQPADTIKILHLSDLHVDLRYGEGSLVECSHPLCCQYSFGIPGDDEKGAGHWGELANCDTPLVTLDVLLAEAAAINPDLVYVTGDLPPHDVWAQDHTTNLLAINVTTALIAKYFPTTPVYHSVGNHASAPVNSFVVPSAYDDGWSMDWLYDTYSNQWVDWVPDAAMADVRRGGYFATSPLSGLKVISLNMNYCNTYNWWLLLENADPTEELKWLVGQLQASEDEGEAVHILGHIPPGGGDCDTIWTHQFNIIVDRYESTIRGLFFGHTHSDSFTVLYDVEAHSRPTAVAYIAPSGTTGSRHNPSFKVYTVDLATQVVVDSQVYNMNMTTANLDPATPPPFSRRYGSQESYGVTSLSPASLDGFVTDMATDDMLFQAYLRNVHNYWQEPIEVATCDLDCRKRELCGLVRGDRTNDEPCQRIVDIVDGIVL